MDRLRLRCVGALLAVAAYRLLAQTSHLAFVIVLGALYAVVDTAGRTCPLRAPDILNR